MAPVGLSPVCAVLPILPALPSIVAIAVAAAVSLLVSASLILRPRFWRQLLVVLWRQKWGVLTLALIVAVPVVLIERSINEPPSSNRGLPSAAAGAPDLSRGSPQPRQTPGPDRGGRNWVAAQPFQFYATPTISSGKVYGVGCQGDRGRFFCWDQHSGELLWTAAPDGYRATYSSPAIAGNYLLCGEGLHHCRDARIICLDLRPRRQGELLWEWRTASHVECTPVVSQGKVYVNAGDDGVYCLAIDPALDPSRRQQWHLPGSRYPDAETALAVYQGRVFVGLGVGGKALCILDADTGRELARLAQPYPVYSRPAIANGRVYVGSGAGNLLTSATGAAGQVSCIDLATFETLWSFPTPDAVMGAVSVDQDDVYVGSADGTLFHLSSSGRLVSRWSAGARLVTAPELTSEFVYVVTADGFLTGLTREQLEPVWRMRLGAPGAYVSSPRVLGGRLFVGTPADGFQCLGERSEVEASIWSGANGGAGCAGGCSGGLLPSAGETLWTFTPEMGQTGEQIVSPLAVTDREVVAQISGPEWTGIVCLDNRGASPPKMRWRLGGAAESTTELAIARSTVLVRGRSPAGVLQVRAVDRDSGQVRWVQNLPPGASGCLAIDEAAIFLSASPRGLSQITLDNDPIWSVSLGRLEHAVHCTPAMVVAATSDPSVLYALDRGTGRTLWKRPLSSRPVGSPVISRGHIVVPLESGVELRSLVDGTVVELGGSRGALRMAPGSNLAVDGAAVFFDRTGSIIDMDTVSGAVVSSRLKPVPEYGPLLTRNRILYFGEGRFWSLSRADRQAGPLVWSRVNVDGITSPPLVQGGRVYVGAASEGLMCLGRAGEK